MLSSSKDKDIELLQLLPTLSKTYPPMYVSYIAPYCADCGKYSLWITFYRLCNNRIVLKYITILCATPCHV